MGNVEGLRRAYDCADSRTLKVGSSIPASSRILISFVFLPFIFNFFDPFSTTFCRFFSWFCLRSCCFASVLNIFSGVICVNTGSPNGRVPESCIREKFCIK